MTHQTVTADERPASTFRCLICQHNQTARTSDACDDCKARMFDEYLAVQGGF